MEKGMAIVVTGGGLGIGREMCRVLTSKGCRVVVADILLEKAEELVRELDTKHGKGTAVSFKCNVTDANEMKGAIQHCTKSFARFDGIINNAGIGENSPFTWYRQAKDEQDELKQIQTFHKVIEIDVNAVVTGTYLALQEFSRLGTKNGVIVNVASMGGILPMENAPVYAAAKSAVIHLTRSLASVSSGYVLAICPSLTETRLLHTMMEETPDGDKLFKKQLGGFLRPEDIAEGARMIIEDAVTGKIGGGTIMRITYRGGYDYWKPGRANKQTIKPVVSAKL